MSSKHLSKGSKMPSPTKDKLRLYSCRFCPYAQRIHLLLDAKNLQYQTIYINVKNKPEWMSKKFPIQQIPILVLENDEILDETMVIANYIDEKYSQNALYPKDPLEKAKDFQLIQKFNKVIKCMHSVIFAFNLDNKDDMGTIRQTLDHFQAELMKRGAYFGVNKPGMVDYMIWPWVERADLLKLFPSTLFLEKDKYKQLLEWKERMLEDKAVKKTYLDTEMHIKFLQTLRAGIPDYDSILSQK